MKLSDVQDRLKVVRRAGRLGCWHWDVSRSVIDLEWPSRGISIETNPPGWAEVIHPGDRDHVEAANLRIVEGADDERTRTIEYRFLVGSDYVPVKEKRAVISRNQNRTPRTISGYFRSTAGLADLERMTAEARANADPAILISGGKIDFVNDRAVTLFGAPSSDALVGSIPLRLIHPEDHGRAIEHVMHALRGNAACRWTQRMVRLDGKAVELELRACPLDEARGKALFISFSNKTS